MAENKELSQPAQETAKKPRFRSQWNGPHDNPGQVFIKPTCTVPDQSMSIPEIIAKYTRTGLVPQSFAKRDEGGNTAFEPDFDPLDQAGEILREFGDSQRARREAESSAIPSGPQAPGEAAQGGEPSAPASAGA